jgi:glycosyltransferase involved in cell wall biosynthesis
VRQQCRARGRPYLHILSIRLAPGRFAGGKTLEDNRGSAAGVTHMTTPLVSVIIPARNAGAYLAETLVSALEQTWHNLEVIVVDDGSTDDTRAVVTPFLPHLYYERQEHLGLAVARNRGIQLTRGEFIAFLDADDLWHPEKIRVQIAVAKRHPLTGLIVSDGEEFADNQIIRRNLLPADLFEGSLTEDFVTSSAHEVTGEFHREFIAGCPIACPAQTLIPRRVVERIGPFTMSRFGDYDYYRRISQVYPITFHRDVLVRYRYRAESLSGPYAYRPIGWGFHHLPLLAAERMRCRPEDAEWLEEQIRESVRFLGYNLMNWGRENHRVRASRLLFKLYWEHPWPPLSLAYLLALWLPSQAYPIGARLYHALCLASHKTKAS